MWISVMEMQIKHENYNGQYLDNQFFFLISVKSYLKKVECFKSVSFIHCY